MKINTLKKCCDCIYFKVLQNKVGYCKLFGELEVARKSKKNCGPDARYFKQEVEYNVFYDNYKCLFLK